MLCVIDISILNKTYLIWFVTPQKCVALLVVFFIVAPRLYALLLIELQTPVICYWYMDKDGIEDIKSDLLHDFWVFAVGSIWTGFKTSINRNKPYGEYWATLRVSNVYPVFFTSVCDQESKTIFRCFHCFAKYWKCWFRGNFTLGLTNMRFIIHPSRPLTTRFTFFLSSFRHCYFKSLIKLNWFLVPINVFFRILKSWR